MCNCLETVLEKVKEQIKPKHEVLDFKCDWKGQVLRFDGGCGVGLYIEQEYRNIKKDGTPYANKNKDEHFIAMSFCPFCGESLKVDEKSS
jgi:hypothetical protein